MSEQQEQTDEKQDDEVHHHEEGPVTHDTSVRAKWLSTLVAFPIALHYPVIVILAAFGVIDITAVPQAWFFFDTLGWLGVLTYIFGEGTIDAARQAMGKDV